MLDNYFAIDLKGYKNPLFSKVVSLIPNMGDYLAMEFDADSFSKRKKEIKHHSPRIVFVRGHTLDFNRKAIEAAETDILSRPYPIDNTLAKLASRNEKIFEICVRDIVGSRGYARARLIQSLSKTVDLSNKYEIPLVITSGAKDIMSLVTPREMISFGVLVGMDFSSAKASISTIPSMLLAGNKK